MTKKKSIVYLLALGFCYEAFWLPAALGEDRDVPPSLIAVRFSLRERRDIYLKHEAEENRCLSEDESLINEINSVLCNQPANWKTLVELRSNRTNCINGHHITIAELKSAIAAVDKDLIVIEDSIRFYANLK